MTKTIYYRACRDRKGFTFQSCICYLINFYNGTCALDLVFGKDQFDRWTITEFSTGFLVHNEKFLTRREAIAAITPEYLKKILDKMQDWQFFEDARARLDKWRSEHQA